MALNFNLIITKITESGTSLLTDEEQQWIVEMTRTRNSQWDPLILEAFLL